MGVHDGHRKRMLERFLKDGADGFSEHELLEMLLYFSVPQKNTNPVSHELINKFGSFANVLDAPDYELEKTPLITYRTACLFKLIKEISRVYSIEKSDTKSSLTQTDEIGDYIMLRYANISEERFSLLSLNSKGKFISFDFLENGDIASVGVSLRKVIETVIRTGATTVVIAHNHPSGIALPSKADLEITFRIREVLSCISVHLKDHIILGNGDYVSLAASRDYKDIFNKGE